MKIKRSYAVALNNVLQNARALFKSPIAGRFLYMVSTNKKLVEEEVKLTLEAFPYDQKYTDFENERIKMLNEAGIFQNSDIAKLTDEQRIDLENRVNKLREANADAIKAEEDISVERNKFLDEEIDLPLRTIGIEDVPEIVAEDNWGIFDILSPIIEEKKA